MAAELVYVGADIGGTKTLLAACTADGQLVRRLSFPTPLELSAGLEQLRTGLAAVAGQAALAAVGISIGGPIDRERGTVSPLHQPQWRGVPLRDLVQEWFGCPCRIEVDTDAAALAEWYIGGVRDSPLVYVTLSTGVGGALLIEGKLYRGTAGVHPELGHQIVPNEFGDPAPVRCTCGAFNCLEALISGRALERRYGCSPAHIPEKDWQLIGQILGHGVRNIATLYAPRRIVLGGGLAIHAAERLLPVLRTLLSDQLQLIPPPTITLSCLGYETPLWGALALALGYGQE